ncbi:MAG: hypothetical protein DRJ45_08315 [Thermoprotei archaeon]|nr:MAG: hypothetical protein DRJ45_08315 [Thermoprotei archaeon]
MKVLFVYYVPHPSHRGFAESIGADFWHYNHYFKGSRLPKIAKSGINGLLLPKYDVYLSEGGAPITPVAIKKHFSRESIHINIIADETFMMMKETPEEMKDKYKGYVNLAHKFASKYIDGGIAVSKLAKESAEAFLDIPIRIVHPYIEEKMYERLSKINPNIKGLNIVSVGYGKPAKGMDILVKAFEIVKEEVRDAELYIIGKGNPKEWNKIEGVHVEGYVDDLIPYFKNASLFVQASRADTFPVTTLEALRAGLPAIVTEKTGTKEVTIKLGMDFVRKVDAEDIAKGILRYFDLSESKRKKLSQKAKELSVMFNKQEMCKRFRQEFWKLLEEIE